MTWIQWAKIYALSLAVFLVVDFTWLGVVAKPFYQRLLGHLFSERVNWPAAFLFYLIFVVGILVFVVSPALQAHEWTRALFFGLLFGVVTYATFDLTNLALIKGWPLSIVVVDILWGAFLSGTVSTAGYFIARWLS